MFLASETESFILFRPQAQKLVTVAFLCTRVATSRALLGYWGVSDTHVTRERGRVFASEGKLACYDCSVFSSKRIAGTLSSAHLSTGLSSIYGGPVHLVCLGRAQG